VIPIVRNIISSCIILTFTFCSQFFYIYNASPDSGEFTLSGADNPGIVHKVTSILAKHDLSIDEMETSDEEAPFGGTLLFNMTGTVSAMHPLASGFNVEKIRDELINLGESLNCDIDLEDINTTGKEASAA